MLSKTVTVSLLFPSQNSIHSVTDKLVPRGLKQRYERLKTSIGESQSQVGESLSSLDKLRILLRELEEDQEARQSREALEKRKIFLRERCFKKLFVGPFAVYQGKAPDLVDFRDHVDEEKNAEGLLFGGKSG